MVLALGSRILDQCIFVKPCTVREDWPGNLDRVIECEFSNDLARCVRKFRKSTSKLRTGGTLNVLEKLTHDIVEQLDLISGEFARSKNKDCLLYTSPSPRDG